MMKVEYRFSRICRRSGGLFLGAKLHFPWNLWQPGPTQPRAWTSVVLFVGLVFWQVVVTFNWNYRNE